MCTDNDRYSGHGYSGIHRYSGTKTPDDAILFTVSGITAIVEQKFRKFRVFPDNFDADLSKNSILKLIKLKNIAFTIFLLSCFQNWPSVSNQVCSLFEAIKKHCSKQSQNSVLKAVATQDSRPHPSIEVNAAVYLFSSHSFGLLQCYAAFNDYSKRPL